MKRYIVLVVLLILLLGCGNRDNKIDIKKFLRSEEFNNQVIRYKADIVGYEDEYSIIEKNSYLTVRESPDINFSYVENNKSVIKFIPAQINMSKFYIENDVMFGEKCGLVKKTHEINYYLNLAKKAGCYDKNIVLSNSPWEINDNGMLIKCKITNTTKENIFNKQHTVAKITCSIPKLNVSYVYFYADRIGFISTQGKEIQSVRSVGSNQSGSAR